MSEASEQNELRVLVAAPTRRDGEITFELLGKAGVDSVVFSRLRDMAAALESGAGALLLTDAALSEPAISRLVEAIHRQPSWSDLPMLLLSRDKVHSPAAARTLQSLSNVTLLDRPSSTRTLVSAVKSALRARRRQYQIRDQLIAQQKADEALRQADKRKDEFLATLAHELRNPLAAIRTGLEVVVRGPGEAQRTERIVGMIDRQSRILVKLIDDLMDVSRISTGKVVLQNERLDLRAVLEATLEGGRTVFDASRHDIALDLPPGPVWVMGDAARLAQVIGNLLNNAGKYTPDEGRITVALTQEDSQAVVRVADNGVGIAPELLEQVFEMFTQVDRTMDRARGGLGIGLSLVRRLVELHGGTVTAQSAGIGKGSTFVVRLPIAAEAGAAATNARAEAVATAPRLKVLVVDDNRDVADGLATLLEFGGHELRIAHDGNSALSEAAAFKPDVVFCDIGMPEMSGHELAARLRSDPKHDSTLLVAVTGWGNEDDKRLSVRAGFDMHFTKPISSEQVQSVLARF
jgi:signal transduction histidine kinase/CheY-like chemotaxis protein